MTDELTFVSTADRYGRKPRDARRSIARDVDGSTLRAHRSERELTVPRPQDSAAIRDFAQDVDVSFLAFPIG